MDLFSQAPAAFAFGFDYYDDYDNDIMNGNECPCPTVSEPVYHILYILEYIPQLKVNTISSNTCILFSVLMKIANNQTETISRQVRLKTAALV